MKIFYIILFISSYVLADAQDQTDLNVDETEVIVDQVINETEEIIEPKTTAELRVAEEIKTVDESQLKESTNESELELNSLGDLEIKENQNQNSPYKLITFLILGLFSISLFLNYLLLSWRSKYKNQLVTFPENLIDQFEGLGKDFSIIKSGVRGEFERYTELLQKQSLINQETVKEVTSKYEAILESFSLLQTSLNTKDKEIERLKKGYDLQILKKFINKYLRIIDTCDAINKDTNISDETKNEVTFILDSLNDLLEDIGIKKYSIDEGVSTKSDEFGLPPANEWIKIETDDDDKCFKVKKTIKSGYFIDAENKEVMKYPKIEVYLKGEKDG